MRRTQYNKYVFVEHEARSKINVCLKIILAQIIIALFLFREYLFLLCCVFESTTYYFRNNLLLSDFDDLAEMHWRQK